MAGSLNKVLLIGRLGADPEIKLGPRKEPTQNRNSCPKPQSDTFLSAR